MLGDVSWHSEEIVINLKLHFQRHHYYYNNDNDDDDDDDDDDAVVHTIHDCGSLGIAQSDDIISMFCIDVRFGNANFHRRKWFTHSTCTKKQRVQINTHVRA